MPRGWDQRKTRLRGGRVRDSPLPLSTEDLVPALAGLPEQFPTADEFHDDVNPARSQRFRDEFAGITNFPFDSV